MAKILLFGEPMALFTATEYGSLKDVKTFERSLAGAEINVGIGLVRLGHEVTYLTRLGEDPLGYGISQRLVEENIDTSMITYDPIYKTGMMMKNIVKTGDPEIAYYRKGSAFSHMHPNIINTLDLSHYDLLHVTGIPCALSEDCREATLRLVRKAKTSGLKISFDPNLRPSLWSSEEIMIETIHEIATYADMILPGISEAEILMGSDDPDQIADYYLQMGIQQVIIKLGSKGAFVKSEQERFIQPGYKVENVVDTVGAGDGFAVGMISAVLEGLSLKEASDRANAIGAMQVSVLGDNEGLPTIEQLKAYMNK
ncbi:sugar kinase [Beduini massiliensis]|uniref:sugar kinase n=1 Tax=Beduini massiliensis TaxID=1585974 RepID=UPI00059AB367|nr:sugar kinase [Beduini massiliensis]